MAAYDRYDERERDRDRDRERDRPRRYVREERYEERDPRYENNPDNYLNAYPPNRDLVPRVREDGDMAVEEIRRDFPPPAGAREIRRARSAEPQYEEYDVGYRRRYDSRYDRDPRDRDSDRDRAGSEYYSSSTRIRKPAAIGYYDDEDSILAEEEAAAAAAKQRMISKQEKILAALAGAALLVGGKEIFDRHEAKQKTDEKEVQRNYLASAALGAAGALAGYQGADFYGKQRTEKEKKRLAIQGRASDDDRDPRDPHERDREPEAPGEKNFLEKILAGTGLGAAIGALTGKKLADGKPGDMKTEGISKIQNAARASIIAGATEAFHIAKQPGGWKGEKAKRIMTVALGAAGIDAAQKDGKNSNLKLLESVTGGLLGNRVINGSKSNIEEDRKTGRSRSRSRAAASANGSSGGGGGGSSGLSGLAALATAGLGALGAKKAYDSYREGSPDDKDRRSRSRRADSDDEKDDKPRSRSRSVVDSARKSLAKLGIGSGVDNNTDKDQDKDDRRTSSRPPPRRRYSDDSDDLDRSRSRGGDRDRGGDKDRGGDRDRERRRRRDDDDSDDEDRRDGRNGRDGRDSRRKDQPRPRKSQSAASDSDLCSSSEDDKKAKKLKGKQILISTLAVAATIHAAHEVYESVEKRHARQKAVSEGQLSPEEAKRLKQKAILQDTASVGIAALGIKSAVHNLKEVREHSHALKEFKHEREQRHQRRLERQKGAGGGSRSLSRPRSPARGGYESDDTYDYYRPPSRSYTRP